MIELNRTAEAKKQIETMRRAKAPAAQMANAYGYLAKDELESYRLNSALDYATKSLEYEPSSKRYATRAAILQRLNRAAEAREDLGRAKALGKKP